MIGYYFNNDWSIIEVHIWQDLLHEGDSIINMLDGRRNLMKMFNYDSCTGEEINWAEIKKLVNKELDKTRKGKL